MRTLAEQIATGHWSLKVRQALADEYAAPQADQGTLHAAIPEQFAVTPLEEDLLR